MASSGSRTWDDFVSCIMPTRDRPQFVGQAIRYFIQQTHARSELVVVDDGEQSVAELCGGIPRVVYLRLDRTTSVGAKMNIGIEHARGAVLQKLDDDDYYHPDFLRTSMSHLPLYRRDRVIVAWDCFLILYAGERIVRYSGHGWASGGTLCFSRELWTRKPFRDEMTGSDHWFRRDHKNRIVRVCAPETYIVVRHGQNTWTRIAGYATADHYMRNLPVYPKSLNTLLPSHARRFYGSLTFGDRTGHSRMRSPASQTFPVSSRNARISRSLVMDSPAADGRPGSPASDNLAWWKW
jgi:glycosyltransferase involved in cell wall biosynthesis